MRGTHNFRALTLFAAVCTISAANANQYVFTPNPANLDNLDHFKYYSWGIQWTIPQAEVITEAVFKVKNIWDWQVEEGDHLYTHLLADPAVGFQTFQDDEGGGDNWNGAGPLVGDYTDPVGGHSTNTDLVYKFSDLGLVDDLNAMVADGKWGMGFDPDCHYWNEGASLTITTQPVPEPASMLGLGLGLTAMVRRFRKK